MNKTFFHNSLIDTISSLFANISEHSQLLKLVTYISLIGKHVDEHLKDTSKQVSKIPSGKYGRATIYRENLLLSSSTLNNEADIPSKFLYLYRTLSDV
jgi:hypothetical protein